MPVTIEKKSFSDFEDLSGITPDALAEVVPLGRGQVEGSLTRVKFGGDQFDISSGEFSRGVRLSGITSPNRFAIGMVTSTGAGATAQQQEISAGSVLVIAPGQERYAAYQGCTSFTATMITPETLQKFLAANHPGTENLPLWRRTTVIQADPAEAAADAERLVAVTEAINGGDLSDEAADFHKRKILEALTKNIVNGHSVKDLRPRPAARLVREADHYLRNAVNRPVHISELCEHFEVHQRMLHRAFYEVHGIAPITFHHQMRLARVFTALKHPGPETTIKRVARAHGFFHLGRFAAEYHRLFRENPSDTLKHAICRTRMIPWALMACKALPAIFCHVVA